jgi:hypothetical protein
MDKVFLKFNAIYMIILFLLTVALTLFNIYIYGTLGNSYTPAEVATQLWPTNLKFVAAFIVPQMVAGNIYIFAKKPVKLDPKLVILLMAVAVVVFIIAAQFI